MYRACPGMGGSGCRLAPDIRLSWLRRLVSGLSAASLAGMSLDTAALCDTQWAWGFGGGLAADIGSMLSYAPSTTRAFEGTRERFAGLLGQQPHSWDEGTSRRANVGYGPWSLSSLMLFRISTLTSRAGTGPCCVLPRSNRHGGVTCAATPNSGCPTNG